MEEKPQNPGGLAGDVLADVPRAGYNPASVSSANAAPAQASFSTSPEANSPLYSASQPSYQAPASAPQQLSKPPFNLKKLLKIAGLIAVIILALVVVWVVAGVFLNRQSGQQNANVGNRFGTISIPLEDFASSGDFALIGTRNLTINGPLRVNDAFTISPSAQPSNANPGQLYYNQDGNYLAYFNGSQFLQVASTGDVVQNIGGATGPITLGGGLAATGGVLSNTGVLSVQGQTGAISLTAGDGIAVDGLTLTNTGVTSFGGQTGDIALGPGLDLSGGTLSNSGVVSLASGTVNLVVTDDGAGNLTISDIGGGSGTVQSPGGTPGRIAKFTGVQTIADSLLSESGSLVTVGGDLSVTGSLSLGTALSVSNGGTGATSLANNGVVIGAGSGALTAVATVTPGLCLVSTAGAPVWNSCTGGSTVTSVNGLSGALTIANATGLGSTITINDASTTQKGIAQFNATNFTAGGGVINTAQNINSGASPTFVNQTLTGDLAVNGGDITSTGNLNVGATGAFTLQGNASSVINATNGVNTTTMSFQTPTANVNYRLPTAAAGNYDICTTVGNCAGLGGAVTTIGGTNGRIAKFTGPQSIGDSLLSETGVTVTVDGNLNLTTGNQFQINGSQISSAALSNDSNLAKLSASQVFTGNANDFRNSSNSAAAFSVQNAAGSRILTIDTEAGEAELGQGSSLDGRLVFNNASNANTITIVPSAATAARTITLPDASGTICLSIGNCAGAGATLQTAYNNSTSPEIVLDSTRGALTIRDNSTPIGANLLEVQNNAGSTTYFSVSTTGTATTGASNVTGNINSSGGSLQTGGTTRIDNSGNAQNIGNISLSGSISGGISYTGSGNINTTGGNIQTAGTSRIDNSGNLINIGNITGAGAVTIASSAGGDININGAGQFNVQDASNFNALSTFNTDVDMAFADTENLQITSTVTGTNSVNVIGAVLTNNTSNGTQQVALLQNAAGSGSTEGLLVLDNADTDTAVANGLQITSAAGGVTTALDVSDPDIVTALLFGANDITGTNFSVTGGSGNITSAGNATLQGGTVTVGTASQAGSLVINDGSSNTGTLQVAAQGQNTTYILPDPGTGTATICLTTGNCAGTGGGVTGAGTSNRLAKFTATGSTIGDSTITDDGTNVTTTVDVIVQGGDLTVGGSSQLGSLLLHDGNGQATTLQAGNSTGNLTFILPTTAGTASQCLKQSGTGNQLIWDSCDGGGGGSSATLQEAYNNGNTITTSDARDIALTLADNTTDSNLTVTVADGSTSFVSFSRANGGGTADPAQMLLVDNLDTDRAVPVGIKLQSAAGGITTAIDATDAEIVDAISVGANNITGTTGNIDLTNFDVVGATGDITTSGDLAVNGGNISSGVALVVTAGGNISLDATGTIELQDNTNVTGNADVSGTLAVGTGNALQVAANGDLTTTGNAVLQGGTITAGTSSQNGTLTLYDGSSNTGSLVTAALGSNRTYTLPDETGTVCLQNSTACGFALSGGNNFIQNQTATDQTADFRISGTGRANTALVSPALRPVADSTTALQIQNAAGSSTALVVDTANLRVGVGAGTAPAEALDVTGNLLVKNAGDTKSYRFRTSGSELDLEASGAALTVSTWSGAGFTGTQRNYLILEEGSHMAQAMGAWQFRTADGTVARHTIDGTIGSSVTFNQNGEATNLNVQGDTDASLLFVHGSTDRVGIGTNAPGHKLDVNGTFGVSGAATLGGLVQLGSLGTANTATFLCRNASNQIAACNTTGNGASWVQGGNSFAGVGVIGTNDNFGLDVEVNNTVVASFTAADGALQLKNHNDSAAAFVVKTEFDGNLFVVDTVNSRVGINLGGSNTPILDSAGLQINGGLRLSGGILDDAFVTPLSASIGTKINIPLYDPGSGNTMIAAGIREDVGVSTSSTVIGVFDSRTNSNHWPTIAVYSPDESNLAGISWAGSNSFARFTTHNKSGSTAGVILQSGESAGSSTITGEVAVRSGSGVGTNTSSGNVNIDSGSTTGSGTAGVVNIATTNATALNLGAGSGGINLTTRSTAGTTIKTNVNTVAFRVLNSSNVPLFQIDTTTDRIHIGNPSADSTGALLVLDTKDTSGDPTGVAGGMYYNSSMGIMRCYWDGRWRPCSAPTSPRFSYKVEEDFLNDASSTGIAGQYSWTSSESGTGAGFSTVASDAATRPGQIQLSTGTTTAGWSTIMISGTDSGGGGDGREQITVTGGEEIEFAINLANLSDVTNEYDARFGLCDEDDADCVDGLYFEYDRNSSTNWRIASANNSTRTKTNTSTSVSTGWHWFKIVVNSAASSVEYFVDGTSVGTISTNIPTTTARRTGPMFQMVKSAGTTARTCTIDYFYMYRSLDSGR